LLRRKEFSSHENEQQNFDLDVNEITSDVFFETNELSSDDNEQQNFDLDVNEITSDVFFETNELSSDDNEQQNFDRDVNEISSDVFFETIELSSHENEEHIFDLDLKKITSDVIFGPPSPLKCGRKRKQKQKIPCFGTMKFFCHTENKTTYGGIHCAGCKALWKKIHVNKNKKKKK